MKPLLDVATIKADFPIFSQEMRGGKRLVFLDSGATSQKPYQVLDAERNFYATSNAAVHRGSYYLAERASEAFEGARQKVADFLGVLSDEIVFTKSATESLNLLAVSFERSVGPLRIKEGDEIVLSELEHHANLLPWQQLAKRTGAVLKWFEMNLDGSLDLSRIDEIITKKCKVVALTHQSNVLGSVPDLAPIISAAHAVGEFLFSMVAKQFRTNLSMFAPSEPTSWSSPGIKPWDQPELVSYGGVKNSSLIWSLSSTAVL